MVVERRFIDGVFRKEEIGPEFIDGLRERVWYAGAEK
jgi:hypothetical protein